MELNSDSLPDKTKCSFYSTDQFNEGTCTSYSQNSFSFLHLNIRSLAKHYDDLVSHLDILDCNFHFLGLSETWLNHNSDPSFYNLPLYQLITSNREIARGGGVALYVHNSLSFTRIDNINIMHCESIFVETVIDNKAIIVGVNYRKPNTPHLEFLHSLESCLDQLSASGKSCIILGDVNIDTSTDSAPAIQYNTLLNSYNFYQIINTATRITDNTSTIIDHCLTNITNYFINCGTLQSDITDHYPIFCIINHIKHILKPANSAQILNFKNYNPDTFLSDLNATSWQPVYDCTDPNIAYEAFYNIFYNIVSNHVHTKTTHHSNSIRKPWLSNGLLKSVRTKHRLFAKMKNNPHNVNYKLKYKKYRNILTKLLKSVKKRYYFNKFRWAQGNINKTWQVINEVLNKSTNKLYPRKLILKTPNNGPLTESSNEFNDFFHKHWSKTCIKYHISQQFHTISGR